MSEEPMFDDDALIQETFMTFRSTPLPPPSLTADDARATVRRRRFTRTAVVTSAVIAAIAVPVAANALVSDGSSKPAPATTITSTTAPATTDTAPEPTATSDSPTLGATGSTSAQAAPVDLAVTASMIVTNASAGSDIKGVTEITVTNDGPSAVAGVDLAFTLVPGVKTSGATWANCDTAGSIVTCHRTAPAVGGSRSFGFQFAITSASGTPSVTARPAGASDPAMANNTAKLTICTNGCEQAPGTSPTADYAVTAGKVVTDGSVGVRTGTVKVTVTNRGPTPGDLVELVFPDTEAFKLTGDARGACYPNEASHTISCSVPAPAVGASKTITYQFTVDLSAQPTGLTVVVSSNVTQDPKTADNTAKLVVCTNGCTL